MRGKEETKEQKERRGGNRNREGEKTNAIVRGSRACIYVRAIVYVYLYTSLLGRAAMHMGLRVSMIAMA